MTVRSCKACIHHNPNAMSIDDAPARCWTCASRDGHPGFHPKDTPVTEPTERRVVINTPSAKPAPDPLAVQVGGDHYKKLAIQPMTYSMANKLDACQHTAIKYITRFRDKGGIADLEKAKHTIDLLIAFERQGISPPSF